MPFDSSSRRVLDEAFSLQDRGHFDKAIVEFDRMIAMSDAALDGQKCETIAQALHGRSETLVMAGRFDEASVAADEVIRRFGDSEEPLYWAIAAGAWLTKVRALIETKRFADALDMVRQVRARYGRERREVFDVLARATMLEACALADDGRVPEALTKFDGLLRDLRGREGEASERLEVLAARDKDRILIDAGRYDDAVRLMDELVARRRGCSSRKTRLELARTMRIHASRLATAMASDTVASAYRQLWSVFAQDDDLSVRQLVARALVARAEDLFDAHPRDALAYAHQVVDWYGGERDPALRGSVAGARALMVADTMQQAGGLAAADAFLAEFGREQDAQAIERVAFVRHLRAERLFDLDRLAEALHAYQDIVARYVDSSSAELRGRAMSALLWQMRVHCVQRASARIEEPLREMGSLLARAEARHERYHDAGMMVESAWLLMSFDRWDRCLELCALLEESLEPAIERRELRVEAEILLMKGRALAYLGRLEEATLVMEAFQERGDIALAVIDHVEATRLVPSATPGRAFFFLETARVETLAKSGRLVEARQALIDLRRHDNGEDPAINALLDDLAEMLSDN